MQKLLLGCLPAILFGSIIVTGADGKMSGMFTERDVIKRVVNEGKDAKKIKLKDVMTSEVRAAKADDEVVDWLRIMSNERFRRLPVVNDAGEVVAIMTQGDFVSYTWPDLMSQVGAVVQEKIPQNYQLHLIAGSVLIYSLILVFFLT